MAEIPQVLPTRIEIRADPIAIERPTNLPSVSRIPCILNLFFDSESKTAFLKFRLSIRTNQQEDQSIYLLVWPEQITSVTVGDNELIQDREISRLCNSSRGAVRLHIELCRAGSVVGPQTGLPLMVARSDSQSCCNLQDIQWLAEQIQLTIYVSCRTISMVQLQELCTALSTPGLLEASTLHKDLTRMYGGQGGKAIENLTLAAEDNPTIIDENDISTQSASPPPYNEATVGPCAGPSVGPAGPSPGLKQRHSHKPSTKRMRSSSSPELDSVLTDIPDPLHFIQSICNKVWDERQAGLSAELSRMEARIMHTVEERVGKLQDELTSQMEQGDGNAVTTAGELIDEALDDRMTSLKVELEDFVRDEFHDVETSIWDQLEAGTWETSFMRRREPQ